jgi:hypothetical protein
MDRGSLIFPVICHFLNQILLTNKQSFVSKFGGPEVSVVVEVFRLFDFESFEVGVVNEFVSRDHFEGTDWHQLAVVLNLVH